MKIFSLLFFYLTATFLLKKFILLNCFINLSNMNLFCIIFIFFALKVECEFHSHQHSSEDGKLLFFP